MFWEDESSTASRAVDRVIDLSFALEGREIPVDHAWPLAQALMDILPWLADEPQASIHNIHVAGSQNGWERPEQNLYLSRRTKLQLRIPATRLADAQALSGQTIKLGAHSLKIGSSKPKSLNSLDTLFARQLVSEASESEHEFLTQIVQELKTLGIPVKKALCGKLMSLQTAEGPLECRSLLLADLDAKSSLLLQEQGLGQHRLLGCGIFIPHKGIQPIQMHQDDSQA
jgi:CRISPR-associated protein Cas6